MKRSHVFAAVATAGLMVGSQAALAQSVGCGSLPQANAAPDELVTRSIGSAR
jgi:hypothetical protein